MSLTYAKNALQIPASGIREISNQAMELPGTIRLELGEPNFTTPAHIAEAAIKAISEGKTRYTSTRGILRLREEICRKLRRVNGIDAQPENIVVTAGGVNAIFAALTAIINPGDEVLIPNPAWPNYTMQVLACGGVVREYPLDPVTFLPTTSAVESLITNQTKVVILNSPGNPTGAVMPAETAQAFVALAEKHDLYIISDEVYDELVYGEVHTSLYPLSPSRVIGIYSFSKTYAMTGWRLGYLVANAELCTTIERVQESTVSCASQISQEAGIVALSGNQTVVQEMRSIYQARRDAIVESLKTSGLYTYTPEGAFYILVNISRSNLASRDFALQLLATDGVAVAPGSAFGQAADHTVRISLASSEEDLRAGIEAIARLVNGS